MEKLPDRKKMTLSSTQATAYWWVNTLKGKLRDLVIGGINDQQEHEFVRLFYYYNETDWRNLYLALNEYIKEDVHNYISERQGDLFSQDADQRSHDRLNEELSEILGQPVPDICLSVRHLKSSVIYTNNSGVFILYKSVGTHQLPLEYEPCYLLTGDLKELDEYNTLVATIAALYRKDPSFRSISLLRTVLCKKYKKKNPDQKLVEIKKQFNYLFERANKNHIVYGCFWEDDYSVRFHEMDLVGLEKYGIEAEEYADLILQEKTLMSKKIYSKKI